MESIEENSQEQNLSKAKIITGVVIAFLLPLLLSLGVAHLPVSYWTKIYASRIVFWAEVLLLWLYARKVEKQSLLILPEKKRGFEFVVTAVVILYLLTIAAQILSAIPVLMGYHEDTTVMRQIAHIVKGRPVLIFFISLTAGVCEEIIFRGYLLTRLSLLFKNQWAPVLLSSLLFAALHYKYNMPREYIFPFLIGVIFSIHYQRFGNIKPLIIVHFIIDVTGLMLASHFMK
ncbi:type II CAAX prenyl endopeptidase Rce1 family protein [Mucilaginibacter ximonensis]|uniref:Type II CAAX prenyl endopeptidase Rce1 family protein n=1 Tax=Mucilaginibacter ximonensis TaxID=538021 RepID=A0ABW5Y6T8_9SPHI